MTPRTAAGRALLDSFEFDGPEQEARVADAILAIEAEADRSLLLDPALRADVKRQEEAVAMFRRNGFVFDNTGKGGGKRWEKMAFTLYGYIVESSEEARAALAATDDLYPALDAEAE